MLSGDIDVLEEILNSFLFETISYNNNKEAFYHGLIIGLLGKLKYYSKVSDREFGLGRPDLVLLPAVKKNVAVIFEFKYSSSELYKELIEKSKDGIEQIKNNQYMEVVCETFGYEKVIGYSIAFYKKTCHVEMVRL